MADSSRKDWTALLRLIQTRLEIKILLILIAVLLAGFGSYVVISNEKESAAMLEQHHEQLRLFSETIMAGIRNVMLTGKSPAASAFVNDAREHLTFASVTIYDRFGKEVFLREGEGVDRTVNDPHVKEALSSRKPFAVPLTMKNGSIFARYDPLLNQPECWRCHDPQFPVRGVSELALKPSMIPSGNPDSAMQKMGMTIGDFIASAFRTIMLSGKGDEMDTLMIASSRIPGITQVRVYRRDGKLAFGLRSTEISDSDIVPLIDRGTADDKWQERPRSFRLFIPLVNQERCQVCHGAYFPMRGVIAIDFSRDSLRQFLKSPTEMFTSALQQSVLASLRSIMLVGRASFVRVYADEISSLNALETFRVFDKDGFERFLNPPPRSRKQLADVLSSKAPLEFVENSGEDEEMVRLSPLANESRCFTCHGKTHAIRAVVEVSSSMKEINKAIRDNQIRSAGIGILTLLLVWGTIRLFMRTVVIKPVQAIGNIADRIGKGDLSARAELDSEDEIGKLAVRMNEMVQGLRERLHLTRFVSQQTVEAVRRAPGTGLQLGGERKTATVFFSDIRGFTSFSERVQPEFVVSMLNEILSKQARIVRKYEGDIDKYVGDELVAVFSGDGMVERAVLAALEIQEAVPTQIGSEILKIGIGINTGDMIMGAMGSADRMDYTVIGDSVNLGARLCSAAPGGQIYLSEYSASHLGESREFALAPLEPISVKGKKDPIRIFVVHRSTQPQASAEVPPSE